jgi:hypothetical protein
MLSKGRRSRLSALDRNIAKVLFLKKSHNYSAQTEMSKVLKCGVNKKTILISFMNLVMIGSATEFVAFLRRNRWRGTL